MRLTIELNTKEHEEDFAVLNLISKALNEVSSMYVQAYANQMEPAEDDDDMADHIEDDMAAPTGEEENAAEPVVEEKPKAKRTRKPKTEPIEEVAETPEVEEPGVEETTEEPSLPNPGVPTPEEMKGVSASIITEVKWREIFTAKKAELGIMPGDAYADKAPIFNDFVHKISADYGNRIPSKLTDEARTRFVDEHFSKIVWNEAHSGFEISNAPF